MGCIAVHGRLGRAALLIIEGRTREFGCSVMSHSRAKGCADRSPHGAPWGSQRRRSPRMSPSPPSSQDTAPDGLQLACWLVPDAHIVAHV